jgi:hypothetical protein
MVLLRVILRITKSLCEVWFDPLPQPLLNLSGKAAFSSRLEEVMIEAFPRRHKTPAFWFVTALLLAVPLSLLAQGGQGRGGPPAAAGAPQGGRAAAPVDLTGYWVSIVTEDWIERMSPDSPPSGTGGARGLGGLRGQAAPAPTSKDPCRVYGAAGSLRVPGRLNITWVDDNTLKIEMDSGTQTRLLRFNPSSPAPAEKSLQGSSVATWEIGARGGRGGAPAAAPRWGSLNVVTTNMTGGYLLSSRSSYSENAVLTEYFTKHSDFGVEYFTVTAMVQDGAATRVTSSTFKKEPNGTKFKPTGCEVVR